MAAGGRKSTEPDRSSRYRRKCPKSILQQRLRPFASGRKTYFGTNWHKKRPFHWLPIRKPFQGIIRKLM
jgi:hypothetical protein